MAPELHGEGLDEEQLAAWCARTTRCLPHAGVLELAATAVHDARGTQGRTQRGAIRGGGRQVCN